MTMVQVPEGTTVPLKVNIMYNRKVMLTKDAPLSSHLLFTFCKLDNFY